MTVGLVKLWQYSKNGDRYLSGMIARDAIEDVQMNEVHLAPLDPEDPTGKTRLDVPDDQKERMMLIKIYKKGQTLLKPNKNGDMEVQAYKTLWYKWADGEKEALLLTKALE